MTRPLLLALLLAACGPASPGATDSAPASTSTGEPATTTLATTSAADTGDVPTSPLSSDTTPPTTDAESGHDTGLATTAATITTHATTATTGETTTGETTSETTTGTTTTTETTAADPDVQYAAFFFAGGLDHILIHKADFTNDRCTTLHLARPTDGDPNLAITVPDEWGPQNAGIVMGTAGCLDGMLGDFGVAATAGAGVVAWPPDPMQLCPAAIDLDLSLDFPQDQPWVPAQEPLTIAGLPVQNCP